MKKIAFCIAILILMPCAAAEVFTYYTGAYETEIREDYDILHINNGELFEQDGMIYQPYGTEVFEIPADKAVKDVRIIEKNKPVSISANIPQLEFYDDEKYRFAQRDCFFPTSEAWIDYRMRYGESAEMTVVFYPLEMKDCDTGEFALYQEIKIEAEYYTPNKIKSVSHSEISPGSRILLDIEIENRKENSEIAIYNPFSLVEKSVYEVVSDRLSAEVDAPEIAEQSYAIEYYENGDIVDRYLISENAKWGSVDFRVLESGKSTVFPLAIELHNTHGENISVLLRIRTIGIDLEEGSEKEMSLIAQPGKNIFYTDFEVSENETNNDLTVEAAYNGITEYAEHNSLVRFSKESFISGLPPSPGQELLEDVARESSGGSDLSKTTAEESESPKEGFSSSTAAGVVIIIALFAIVGYLVKIYLKWE